MLILATAICAFAQSQATTGNIEGRVLDPTQTAVPSATVPATNQLTGLEKSATTSDEGTFTISFLPPGPYTVRANAAAATFGLPRSINTPRQLTARDQV